MAEVRLAMLGMGKAMTEWLDLLHGSGAKDATEEEIESAKRGLERIRDGLIETAVGDVDDLVKQWAWNDDLDTSRSRSTAATPVSMQVPEPSTPPPRSSSLAQSQTTPKASVKKQSPTVPKQPQPQPPSPKLQENIPPKPIQPVSPESSRLHLSTRGDRPTAAIPRIPLHQPKPTHGRASSTSESLAKISAHAELDPALLSRPASVPKSQTPPPASAKPAAPVPSGPVDPLAGVGVGLMRSGSTAREEKRRSAFKHAAPSTSASIPVGADPLGASG